MPSRTYGGELDACPLWSAGGLPRLVRRNFALSAQQASRRAVRYTRERAAPAIEN